MKASSGAAMALAVGYVLGRRRKLRTAVILAGAAASGRAGSLAGTAIKRGMNLAETSNTLGKLTPHFGGISAAVCDELLKAGRAAAVAVVNDRIESLSDSLHQRAESIRGLGPGTGDGDDGEYSDDFEEPEGAYEDESDLEPEGRYADDADGEPQDAYDEDEYEDRRAPAPQSGR